MAKCCPRCGSQHLNYEPWLGEIYVCRDCGYQGALIIEDGEIADALSKQSEIEETEK